jgi:hypothetical protein
MKKEQEWSGSLISSQIRYHLTKMLQMLITLQLCPNPDPTKRLANALNTCTPVLFNSVVIQGTSPK